MTLDSRVSPVQRAALIDKLDSLQDSVAAEGERLPRRFGPYSLLAVLGRGGMGEVFLARAGGLAGLERTCVVKTLRPHLTDDREYVARFIDEARVVVQLTHKNLCNVFDVGRVQESNGQWRYYLAMDLVGGIDIRTVGDTKVPLPPGLAVHVACEVLEALHYAHQRIEDSTGRALQLVHRDVSPQNIMLSFAGEVKLIDFGLASSALKVERTAPQVVMGKLAYMSPEHVRGDSLTHATDQFSCAIVAYEMLTGLRFYDDMSGYQVWTEASVGGHRPAVFSSLPVGIQAVLDRALASDPGHRFPSCLAFREELIRFSLSAGWRGDGPLLEAHIRHHFALAHQRHQAALLEAGRQVVVTDRAEPSERFAGASLPPIAVQATPGQTVKIAPIDVDRTPWNTGWLAFGLAAALMLGVALAPRSLPAVTVDAEPVVVPVVAAPSVIEPLTPSVVPPALDDVPVAVEQPVVAEADSRVPEVTSTKPPKLSSRRDRVDYLRRSCPQSPCSTLLRDRFKRFGALSVKEMVAFDAALQQCVQGCK
jgi:eukaryotic-like serine/threonine-protein kinase